MTSRVVVAIAAYNDERYLPAALDALAAQEDTELDVLFLDDGSSDRTTAIASSYSDRLAITVWSEPRRGRHDAKRTIADRALATKKPYLLVLDSDIALPSDAVARMTLLLDEHPDVAVVSAHARSDANRPWGRGQAHMEDVFLYSHTVEDGGGRWIVGGCSLFRRAALEGLEIRSDLLEDSDMSEKLRASWRILCPRDLVATHYGVPTSLRGIVERGYRDGVRVRALHRAYPHSATASTLGRIVPLPLAAATAAGALTLNAPLVGAGLTGLGGYAALFVTLARNVPASMLDRALGAATFTIANVGFGAGYLRELVRQPGDALAEPARPQTR